MTGGVGRPRLVVVIGGTRSGKSEVAEGLLDRDGAVTYVATGAADDEEMAARVQRHRERRPASWRTVETADVGVVVAAAEGDVLVDSVGAWVRARMDAEDLWEAGDLDGLADEASRWAEGASGTVVVVAEDVGGGVVPTGRGTRRWVDVVGAVTRRLVAQADRALLVIAGRVVDLPPAAPTDAHPEADDAHPSADDVQGGGDDVQDRGEATGHDGGRGDRLRLHGDTMVPDGAIDLAVNVRPGPPPRHVREALQRAAVGRYPDTTETCEVVAGHIGVRPDNVVLLAGAAEAFWLLPHALRPRRAAVVHPTFTAPEAALRACDVDVVRVPRDAAAGWALRPDRVPDDADLVVLGNPNNPTGTLDEPGDIVGLCRPGRMVVVDEAFMDFVVDARSSLAGAVQDRGLVVIRSVTKLWSVPGVRAGYLLADTATAARLRAHQQPWPVSAQALAVICAAVQEESWRIDTAVGVAARRAALVRRLRRVEGITVHDGAANFVLIEVPAGPAVHRALLARGVAVRPSTFPLLPSRFLRVAVTEADEAEALATALESIR